jgi:cyclopropane fatty-acyl-phospholipid synthase-like methyltransferase
MALTTNLTANETSLNFDPSVCDLCKATGGETILDIPDISMTSDSQIIKTGLRKVQCERCKLVRNGYSFSTDRLSAHYGEEYELGEQAALAEPLFFTENGPVPRSGMIFNWMIENLQAVGFSEPRSVAEIGCGEGSLLSHFASYWKGSDLTGFDMSERSLRQAERKGLKVQQGSYRDVRELYDLIFSFAVIEHVPSPSDFLAYLKSHLTPGGLLLTAQPCQDEGGDASYDIFFSDHLHHFFSNHVAELGRRMGLSEVRRATRNNYILDFSLHIFEHGEQRTGWSFEEAVNGQGDLRRTVKKWLATFNNINNWLELNRGRKIAVWGVGQAFTFFYAYTNLRNYPIVVAFDDNPDRYKSKGFEFPVIRFESAQTFNNMAVLFTFAPRGDVLNRLNERSISYYCPFSA